MHSLAVLALASLVPVRSTAGEIPQSETGKGKDLTFAYFDHHLSLLKVAQVLFQSLDTAELENKRVELIPHLRPLPHFFLAKVLLKVALFCSRRPTSKSSRMSVSIRSARRVFLLLLSVSNLSIFRAV